MAQAQSEEFPLYGQLERRSQKDRFLTVDELVVQTDRFMQRFAEFNQKVEFPDTVFFIDKSARPLAYMFKELFPVYCPGAEMPQIRFINIGGSGGKKHDPEERPFKGHPAIVRRLYGGHLNQEGKIAIVNEYSHKGTASIMAWEVLEAAFPQAELISMVVYDKLPNWYQNHPYLGVEEYTQYDYERMALARLNEELKTKYKSRIELFAENVPPQVTSRFWEIYHEIEGTTPHTKRGKHIQVTYEHPDLTAGQKFARILGRKVEEPPPIETRRNLFKEARTELDRICRKVLEQKKKRESS